MDKTSTSFASYTIFNTWIKLELWVTPSWLLILWLEIQKSHHFSIYQSSQVQLDPIRSVALFNDYHGTPRNECCQNSIKTYTIQKWLHSFWSTDVWLTCNVYQYLVLAKRSGTEILTFSETESITETCSTSWSHRKLQIYKSLWYLNPPCAERSWCGPSFTH